MLFTLAVTENVCKLSKVCVHTEDSAVYGVCFHENQEMKLFPMPPFQNTGPEASEELDFIRQSLSKRHITVHLGAVHNNEVRSFSAVCLSNTAAWFFIDNQVPICDNIALNHVLLSSQRQDEHSGSEPTLPDNLT